MTGKLKQEQSQTRLKISTPDFQPLTAEEASQIRGGGWGAGTCVVVGYACYCKGGFGVGVCLLAGYASSAKQGG
ncbi:MAG: hypothetical protein Q8O40_13390 [Chloroflexota bacterium]|nr:hypothetical protein [Chloroflexota bacterium]